ncbi:MAG: hypothetical protein HY910_06305 [Desulfarculus sp.]|nr:hypothetical protein [Desulfarculus sp.]
MGISYGAGMGWLTRIGPGQAAPVAGAALGTPHAWLDPAGWWANFWAESASQYAAGADVGPQEGLKYLVRALVHCFSWPWRWARPCSWATWAWPPPATPG